MDHSPREVGKTRRRAERRKASGRGLPAEKLAARLVTLADTTNEASEAYRTLRTNLIYSSVDTPPRVIVLTSPGPGEGKSTTCANLGVVLSQAGKSSLIVDCDFRKPVMHKFFGLRNLEGLVDVLVGEHTVQEVAKKPIEGLSLIPVGPVPPNPSELLSSQRFATFVSDVRPLFDYVLVDAPPVGVVTDPAILAIQSDGVLLVLDAQNTRKASVRQAMRSLEAVGANVLGTVMNNVAASNAGYYHDYAWG